MARHHRDGRRWLLVAVVLGVMTALGAGQPAELAAVALRPNRSGWPAGDQPATSAGTTIIRSHGTGRVAATPDQATVEVGIEVRHTDPAFALRRNAETTDRVLRSLRRAGVDEDSILRGALQVQSERLATTEGLATPAMEVEPEATAELVLPASDTVVAAPASGTLAPEPAAQVAYTVWNTVRFTTPDLEGLPDLLATALEAGASQVLFVRYELSDDAAYRRQAIRLAVQAAIGDAQALADVLGVEIRRVTDVQLDGLDTAPPSAELPLWSSASTRVAGALGYVEARVILLAEVASVDPARVAAMPTSTVHEATGAATEGSWRASATASSTRRPTSRMATEESRRPSATTGHATTSAQATKRATRASRTQASSTPPPVSDSRASLVAERETRTVSRRQTATAKATQSPAVTPEAKASRRSIPSPEVSPPPDDRRRTIAFRTLLQGPTARYREPDPVAILVTSEAEFASQLAALLPRGVTVDVDFDRYALVGVFLGGQAVGETVQVEAVHVQGDTVSVEASRGRAPAGDSDTASARSPYELVRLSQGDIPPSARREPRIALRVADRSSR